MAIIRQGEDPATDEANTAGNSLAAMIFAGETTNFGNGEIE